MGPHVETPLRRGRHRVGPRRVTLVAVFSLAAASNASAQHVRGRLVDLRTDGAIAAGFLTLLAADKSVITSTVTNADGEWRLDVPAPGVYYVAAERLGYRSWVSGPFQIGADDELNSIFHLEPLPITLDPIDVQAAAVRRHLEYNGFFERQRSNFGHFVTPEAIARRQAARVTDLLSAIPGVHLVSLVGASAGPLEIQLRGSSLSQGGLCRPRVFVDGLMYNPGDSRPVRLRESNAIERAVDEERLGPGLSLDDIGHPSTIAAIEVYRSASQVPVQFGGSSVETLCGVIVVWTRTGRMRTGAR
ncbi:MAG: Plug and carboxypeptidase regulatory-like domain-containing protein [Gemmatimonadetes bacterium]|nr:Plug and carboxypeptidase regulatory-like domain-containing protein [Gemmatimonadota bacterium]